MSPLYFRSFLFKAKPPPVSDLTPSSRITRLPWWPSCSITTTSAPGTAPRRTPAPPQALWAGPVTAQRPWSSGSSWSWASSVTSWCSWCSRASPGCGLRSAYCWSTSAPATCSSACSGLPSASRPVCVAGGWPGPTGAGGTVSPTRFSVSDRYVVIPLLHDSIAPCYSGALVLASLLINSFLLTYFYIWKFFILLYEVVFSGTRISFRINKVLSYLTRLSLCLSGVVSLVSLSLLSYERYSVLLCSIQSDSSQYRRARLAVAASWLYSLVWTLPPLLGWSRSVQHQHYPTSISTWSMNQVKLEHTVCPVLWSSYGPEGPGTTCSVQWHQRSAASRSYVGCLFVFCLLLPLLLMLFCYGRILLAVREVSSQLDLWPQRNCVTSSSDVKDLVLLSKVNRVNRSSAERKEGRILLMVVSMVTGYLLCWMPYGIVAMLSSFGRPGVVPPAASLVPSLLAKTSTVLNPVIYVLLNNQVTTAPRKYSSSENSCFPSSNWDLLLFKSKQNKLQVCMSFYETSARPCQLKDRFTQWKYNFTIIWIFWFLNK